MSGVGVVLYIEDRAEIVLAWAAWQVAFIWFPHSIHRLIAIQHSPIIEMDSNLQLDEVHLPPRAPV